MVKIAASKRYVKMLPEVTWSPTALKMPGGLCPGWLTPALSQLPSASLWESFLPRAAFPPPPGGLCLSYHLSVTVVSPPELPQNKVVGFDALAGREQKRIILALEAGCPNSGCQQGPSPSSPSGVRSPLRLLVVCCCSSACGGLSPIHWLHVEGWVSCVHIILPLRVCLSLCT